MKARRFASGLALVLGFGPGCYSGFEGAANSQGGDSEPSGSDTAPSGSEGEATDGDDETGGEPEEAPELIGLSGVRRLTRVEYIETVADLLEIDAGAATVTLPSDDLVPFDNDYTTQAESASLIVGVESLAGAIATELVADEAKASALLGCSMSGAIDAECFDGFLQRFGRRVLRRPITDDERATWSAFMLGQAEAADRFGLALETAVRLFLQHPEFLYRVDRGELVEGSADVVRLDDWAVASRLSFLLWGVGPDDALLDVAARGELRTTGSIAAQAERMLDDDRARARIERFHALWMGYEVMAIGGELGDSMRAETGALISRVVFDEDRPWQDIFRSSETFVSDALAEHYGIEAPTDPAGGWVDYGDSGRGGILSHGTFLSNGFKDGDTSPIIRGQVVSTMLLCMSVPEPPDNVPPAPEAEEGACKIDEAAAHLTQASCAGCHAMLDEIGFGLENYDEFGQFREHDPGKPDCVIEGDGTAPGLGSFNGPAELGERMADAELLNECIARQVYRFAVGRTELDDVDDALIDRTVDSLGEGDFRFRDLLLEHVTDPAFGFARRQEENE